MPTGTEPPKTFVYDTAVPPALAQKKYDLLPLYNEKYPMLAQRMVDFDVTDAPMNIVDFCNQLLATMNHYGGIGLAANQCGIPYRLFVMAGGIVCINPRILTASIETLREKEGCLSFPGLMLPVTRPRTIEVEFLNEFGVLTTRTFTGTTAKVFQHELDHLNGIVFTSHVGTLTLSMAKKKKKKLIKKMERVVAVKDLQRRVQEQREATAKPVAPRAVVVPSNRVT